MFGSREEKGKEKKNVCLVFKSREMERRKCVIYFNTLIGEVSKRPNRQNCNIGRNRKSKNEKKLPPSPFHIFLHLCSGRNGRNTIPSSISFPYRLLPTITNTTLDFNVYKCAFDNTYFSQFILLFNLFLLLFMTLLHVLIICMGLIVLF